MRAIRTLAEIVTLCSIVCLSVASSKDPSAAEASKATGPAIVVSPDELITAYDENEIAADNKFKGKRLKISGTVQDIGKDIADEPYLTLATTIDGIRKPQAFFSESDSAPLAGLKKGQTVTVECTCDGLMMNVLMKSCRLL